MFEIGPNTRLRVSPFFEKNCGRGRHSVFTLQQNVDAGVLWTSNGGIRPFDERRGPLGCQR